MSLSSKQLDKAYELKSRLTELEHLRDFLGDGIRILVYALDADMERHLSPEALGRIAAAADDELRKAAHDAYNELVEMGIADVKPPAGKLIPLGVEDKVASAARKRQEEVRYQ